MNPNDLDDMETTADKSMVLVEMLDEGVRRGDPIGRYLSIEDAYRQEASGACRIRRKSDVLSYEKTPDGRVFVEHLDKRLIDSYGKVGIFSLKDAEKGAREGKWRIRKVGMPQRTYETQVMTPVPVGTAPDALTGRDLFGSSYQTKGLKKKHVAWLQDNFIRGGAEISSELVIRIGIDCGFDISMLTSKVAPEIMTQIMKGSDLIIINNIWGFHQPQMKALLEAIYSDGKPYVKYEHDHRELDRPEFSGPLFQRSILNVFLSPIHLENHRKALGAQGICLPLAIDPDLFRPDVRVKRGDGTALICNLRNFKSWINLQGYINSNSRVLFTALTNGSLPINGTNVMRKGMVPYEEMPSIYTHYKYVVHLLDGWGAGERVILEGALCGCKIVANDKVGHMSWGRNLEDVDELREWLRQAPYSFWNEITSRMK